MASTDEPHPADVAAASPARAASSTRERLVAIGLVAIPFVALLVALRGRDWFPTGDLAYGELRLQSMPRRIPLLGTAGRIEDAAGRQGNHPGPLMFWAMWPLYAIFGRSSWAFSASAIGVNLIWTALAVHLAGLRIRFLGLLILVATLLALFTGFGLDALSQPWNPWMALFPFITLVFATWASYLGVRWAPVVAVLAGSFSVQSHIGYVVVVLPLVLISLIAVVRFPDGRSRTDSTDRADEAGRPEAMPRSRRLLPVGVAVLVGLLAWSGPIIDLLTAEHHNVGKLIHNFGSPDEPPVGFVAAVETVTRTLNPFVSRGSGTTVVSTAPWTALLFLGVWALVAAVNARRGTDRRLDVLNLLLTVTLGTTVFAVSRIFGSLYLYVYRWAEILLWSMVFSLVWGLVRLVGVDRIRTRFAIDAARERLLRIGAIVVVAALGVLSATHAVGQEIPYGYTWKAERALAPEVADRLDPELRYLVRFDDPIYLFGVGFGMILELERRGFDVGAPVQWRAAVEPHRVRCGGDHDAVITVVSGLSRIAAWRDDPAATEIAEARSGAPGAYEAQRDRLQRALSIEGRDVPLEEIEDQIYGIFFFDRSSPEVRAETEELIAVGAPSAVFLTEPETTEPILCD